MKIDTDKLNAFMGKMLVDVGAAIGASLMLIGDKLGLYKALARGGPMTSAELANATSTTERYVREWLAAQAAAGYVDYDSSSAKFSMSRRSRRPFGPAKVWGGTSAAPAYSAAPPGSSVRATSIISCRSGCRHSRV